MLPLFFFIPAILVACFKLFYTQDKTIQIGSKIFMNSILFFSVGLFSLFSGCGHIFMGPEIAKQIGWPPGSPFQFEVGVANLSYGLLGVLAPFLHSRFSLATILGWSVFLIGAFIGHIIQETTTGNTAPYNFGFFIWFNDLFLPLLLLSLLATCERERQ